MISGGFEYVVKLQAMRGAGQDRAAVFERQDGGLVIALADGAGGTSNGELAAQAVVETAQVLAGSDAEWSVLLRALDRDVNRLQGGQTTAIVLVVNEDGIRGASVGDSEAWVVYPDRRIEALTHEQDRKPLLGSGANPAPAAGGPIVEATLLVASDGLFRLAKPMDIARVVAGANLEQVAEQLLDLVRTEVGNVLDDVSIVLCRRIVI